MEYKKAYYNAFTVSEEVIRYSNRQSLSISNLKLQKVLYFIQAYFLVECGRACFEEDIEAWAFGPVVPAIYRKYRIFGANSIPESACEEHSFISIFSPTIVQKQSSVLMDKDKHIIQEVVDNLAEFSATQLVEKTHQQAPWIDAYVPRFNNVISNDSILNYFKCRS